MRTLRSGIWGWESGTHFVLPCMEKRGQGFRSLSLLGREVVVFAGIIVEVIQLEVPVFEEFYELPIALPHSGTRTSALVPVVGVMPV